MAKEYLPFLLSSRNLLAYFFGRILRYILTKSPTKFHLPDSKDQGVSHGLPRKGHRGEGLQKALVQA